MRRKILKYCMKIWGIAAVIVAAALCITILTDADIRNLPSANGGGPAGNDSTQIYSSYGPAGNDSTQIDSGYAPADNYSIQTDSYYTPVSEEYAHIAESGDNVKTISIACWGDSLMEGYNKGSAIININGEIKDISCYDTPKTIQELTSINTYNFGASGETSYEIALRAGGIPIYTDRNICINNYSYTSVRLIDGGRQTVYMEDYSGYGNEYNEYPDTVIINNRLCHVKRKADSEEVMIAICSNPEETGIEKMNVYAGTLVIPKAAFDHNGDILVLELGSNGGWDCDYQMLVSQYQSIINFCGCSDYIIVGDTDDPGASLADYNQSAVDKNGEYIGSRDTDWEAALRAAFGEHFLNTRTYLIENGLSDCGMQASQEDIDNAQMGFISHRLKSDWTHFNSYGYYSKGMAVYLKGVELGYWS